MDQRSIKQQSPVKQIALAVFGVLAFVTLFLSFFHEKGVLQVRAQSQKLSALESEVSKIEAENKAITGEIHALRSDPSTIEKIAREELKLVKPGEVVLVTPPANDNSSTATPPR